MIKNLQTTQSARGDEDRQYGRSDIVNKPLFVGLGILVWFIGLICIRIFGPTLFAAGDPLLLALFAASVPGALVLIKFSAAVGKVQGHPLFSAVTLMCLTALLLDGVALTWFQPAYGLLSGSLALAAAWLLWDVGITLLVALLLTGGVRD